MMVHDDKASDGLKACTPRDIHTLRAYQGTNWWSVEEIRDLNIRISGCWATDWRPLIGVARTCCIQIEYVDKG